jgi:hypothetical protein
LVLFCFFWDRVSWINCPGLDLNLNPSE